MDVSNKWMNKKYSNIPQKFHICFNMTNTLKGLPPITFFFMHDLMQTMVQNIGLEIYISERHLCVVSASESKKRIHINISVLHVHVLQYKCFKYAHFWENRISLILWLWYMSTPLLKGLFQSTIQQRISS